MFWQVISGVAVAAGNQGRHRITRSRFRLIALLIAAIWVLLGIWAFRPPDGREVSHILPGRGSVSDPGTSYTPSRIYHRKPVLQRRAE